MTTRCAYVKLEPHGNAHTKKEARNYREIPLHLHEKKKKANQNESKVKQKCDGSDCMLFSLYSGVILGGKTMHTKRHHSFLEGGHEE